MNSTHTSQREQEIDIALIQTDIQRFQERHQAYSEHTYLNILHHYDPNKFDAIVVWRDSDGTIYVLAGHSRLAGCKARGHTTILVRFFIGNEEDAITFALDSNSDRTTPTDLERAGRYRKLIDKGESIANVMRLAKTNDQNRGVYQVELATLNPKGKFIHLLKSLQHSSDKATLDTISKASSMVGSVRVMLPHRFSNKHENECYHYLIEHNKLLDFNSKSSFKTLINARFDNYNYIDDEPLHLIKHRENNSVKLQQDINTCRKMMRHAIKKWETAIRQNILDVEKVTPLVLQQLHSANFDHELIFFKQYRNAYINLCLLQQQKSKAKDKVKNNARMVKFAVKKRGAMTKRQVITANNIVKNEVITIVNLLIGDAFYFSGRKKIKYIVIAIDDLYVHYRSLCYLYTKNIYKSKKDNIKKIIKTPIIV